MISTPDSGGDRRRLRQQLRERRRALPAGRRALAEQAVIHRVARSHIFAAASSIALYDAVDGELDVWPLTALALAARKRVYLPVLRSVRRLAFAPLNAETPLVPNRFGILEPDGAPWVDPRRLDLVLTPLVGFDVAGTRLGMGAGYYDRAFGFLLRRRAWLRPKLVGVAFDEQLTPRLHRESWDVPVWRVVTPTRIYGPNGPLTGDPSE